MTNFHLACALQGFERAPAREKLLEAFEELKRDRGQQPEDYAKTFEKET